MMRSVRSVLYSGVALVALASGSPAMAQVKAFDIPAERASDAIPEFASQAGIQIVAPGDDLKGVRTPAIKGSLELHAALAQLLSGTQLEIGSDDGQTILLRARPKNAQAASNDGAAPTRTGSVETVVVTGTNLRGVAPTGSPVHSFDRSDIEESGYGTIGAFMNSLPWNLAGTNTATVGAPDDAANGNVGGTAIDLRGLGADSTLVLLNGERIAPAGTVGRFVDVSAIPESMIQRVDVLTDGASAVYGSDAVAGVVNFVLRDDYDGIESSARYGGSTQGGGNELHLSQSAGHQWSTGDAAIAFDYSTQTPVEAQNRSYSSGQGEFDLTPDTIGRSVFGMVNQQIGSDVRVRANVLYTNKSMSQISLADPTTPFATDLNLEQLSTTLGAVADLGSGWSAELNSTYGKNTSTINNSLFGVEQGDAQLTTVDVKIQGALFSLAGGSAQLALGGQFRDEEFKNANTGAYAAGGTISAGRRVFSGFVEIHLPIFGDDEGRTAMRSLDVDIAARYENYSDFGSTTNPKIGVDWSPLGGLHLTTSIGTSFRAPELADLNGGQQVLLINEPDPLAPGTQVPALFVEGASPVLTPEKSLSWHVGAAWQPSSDPGLRISADYFNIDFSDRIANPMLPFFDALSIPGFVVRNPSSTLVNALAAGPRTTFFENLTSIPGLGPAATLSQVQAIADDRIANLATSRVDGLDFDLRDSGQFGNADWKLGLIGTYLLHDDYKPLAGAPAVKELDTIFNPIDLRFKVFGNVAWDGLSATVTLNYANSYENNTTPLTSPIASWTTVDSVVQYDVGPSVFGDRTQLTLSVLNLFDTAPPSVPIIGTFSSFQPGFDPANANPLGRFISFEIAQKW